MRLLGLWLIGALLLPVPAAAQDAYGSVTVLKERRAGFLEEVKSARSVVVVRAGTTLPVTRGLAVLSGDVVRTTRGTCVVTTPAGWTVAVGEDSEVTLGPTLSERIGTLFLRVQGAFSVETDEVEVLVEGTEFFVTRAVDAGVGSGTVATLDGTVKVTGGASPQAVTAPSQAAYRGPPGSVTVGAATPLTGKPLRQLLRQSRLLSERAPRSWRKRMFVRVGGGAGSQQERAWGRAQLGLGVRLLGPLWLEVDGGIQGRPVVVQEDGADVVRQALSIPITIGGQAMFDLPAGGFAHAGPALTLLVGERCVDIATCERAVDVEPGFAVDGGVGVFLGPVVALDLRLRVGLDRRRRFDGGTVASSGVGLQLLGGAGVRIRL